MDSIEKLAEEFNKIFKKEEKLDKYIYILDLYSGSDWKKYTKFCRKNYTRNLVFQNSKFEILIICWNKEQVSPIHDHPKNGCILKLLQGTLIEECYSIDDNNKLHIVSHNKINPNDISYQ